MEIKVDLTKRVGSTNADGGREGQRVIRKVFIKAVYGCGLMRRLCDRWLY